MVHRSLETSDMVEMLSNLSEIVTLHLNGSGLKALPIEAVKNMNKLENYTSTRTI